MHELLCICVEDTGCLILSHSYYLEKGPLREHGAGKIAQLVKCLPSKYKDLSLVFSPQEKSQTWCCTLVFPEFQR